METAAIIAKIFALIVVPLYALFCVFGSSRSRIKNKIEEQSESFSERVVRRSIIINQDKKGDKDG